MEPITLALLATFGGLWALNKSKNSKHSKQSTTPSVPLKGVLLTCSQIELTDRQEFKEYLQEVINQAVKKPKFSNPITIPYLEFLEHCYQKIAGSQKCSPIDENKRAIIYIIKRLISGLYNQLVLEGQGLTINGQLVMLHKDYMNQIVKPAMNKLATSLKLQQSDIELIFDIYLITGKYPNSYYIDPEDAGFSIECGIESNINITDIEKFDKYLKDIVKTLGEKWQFKDPYLIDFEKFIDEYLKMINNYCYWAFKQKTISDHGRRILYILIQYGLQNYIDLKFNTEELRDMYRKQFFDSDWEKLQKKYPGITDPEIYDLEEILKDQGQV